VLYGLNVTVKVHGPLTSITLGEVQVACLKFFSKLRVSLD
jgi:hypothetical protein